MATHQFRSTSEHQRSKGFTLIELLVTIAIVAIIFALGLPSLREFLVRNQVGSITSDFASDVSRTRVEAISRNGCVTMCTSTNTAVALNSPPGTPICSTTSNNWQTGWIIFSNAGCSTTLITPDTANPLIAVRQKGADSFELEPTSSATRITFDSRGLSAGVQNTFTLRYLPEGVNSPHYRTICLSSAGRVTTKKYLESCP